MTYEVAETIGSIKASLDIISNTLILWSFIGGVIVVVVTLEYFLGRRR